MTLEEYFGDWMKVIDREELLKVTNKLKSIYATKKVHSPKYNNIFKAFSITPYNNLHTIMLFQDPSSNDNVINNESLEVLRESIIDYTIPHYGLQNNEDIIEYLSKQGILMLNTSLTVECGKAGSHSVLWKKFMINLIKNLNTYNPGLIWVLWGISAKSFKKYITSGIIINEQHPDYYVRNNLKINSTFFKNLDKMI